MRGCDTRQPKASPSGGSCRRSRLMRAMYCETEQHLIRPPFGRPPSPQGEGFGCGNAPPQKVGRQPSRANRLRSRQTTASVGRRDERRPYSAKAISPPASIAGGFQRGAHIPLWRVFLSGSTRFLSARAERNGVDYPATSRTARHLIRPPFGRPPSPQGEGFGRGRLTRRRNVF